MRAAAYELVQKHKVTPVFFFKYVSSKTNQHRKWHMIWKFYIHNDGQDWNVACISQSTTSDLKWPLVKIAQTCEMITPKVQQSVPSQTWYSISHDIWCTVLFCYALCCSYVIRYYSFFVVDLCVFFRVASLALGQSYDCPRAREATLKNMSKYMM